MSESHLRAVPDSGEEPAAPVATGSAGEARSWIPTALAIALVIALGLLVWSRVQQGAQIDTLQTEIRALEADVAARDRVLDAQQQRLGDVKGHLQQLQTLMDEPLPSIE